VLPEVPDERYVLRDRFDLGWALEQLTSTPFSGRPAVLMSIPYFWSAS
jgi:hypothetical protein